MTHEDPYRDKDLVEIYDLDNPSGVDHDYYRGLAESRDARVIVDLGCGTGLLTRTLVRPCRTVIGVDPSATMLEYARSRPGADSVSWILGDAGDLPDDLDADLVLCTGNAIMHLDHDQLLAALRRIRATLRAGGMLAFESRNPSARTWEKWTRALTIGERDSPLGTLRTWLEVTEVSDGRVSFDSHTVLESGEDRVYRSVLYFRSADELTTALTASGFDTVTIDGGWSGETVSADARLLVVRAT